MKNHQNRAKVTSMKSSKETSSSFLRFIRCTTDSSAATSIDAMHRRRPRENNIEFLREVPRKSTIYYFQGD